MSSQRTRKSWFDYTVAQRQKYLEDNFDKADCEFLVVSKNNKTSKVLKSFKWILSDVSPKLQNLIKKNSDKQIRIDNTDPEDFECFLRYIHNYGMTLPSQSSLWTAYVLGKVFKVDIKPLIKELSQVFNENWETHWLLLFYEAYSNEDASLQFLFETMQLNRSLKLSLDDDSLELITKMSVKALGKLINLLLSDCQTSDATKILSEYLKNNWKNLSNLDRDIVRGFASHPKITVFLNSSSYESSTYLDALLH